MRKSWATTGIIISIKRELHKIGQGSDDFLCKVFVKNTNICSKGV